MKLSKRIIDNKFWGVGEIEQLEEEAVTHQEEWDWLMSVNEKWQFKCQKLETEKEAAHYQIERAITQLEDADLNYTPEVCIIAASVRAQLQAYMESIK